MHAAPPLILTIALDTEAHDYFTGLRTRYFPTWCNYLEAHLTLFHNLPPGDPLIEEVLVRSMNMNKLELLVNGIENSGNSVAFTIDSKALLELHRTLQQSFSKFLINRDRQKLWPHITVQNKVTAFKAKKTTEILLQDFAPFTIQGIGISSWHYLKGPWQHYRTYEFNKSG